MPNSIRSESGRIGKRAPQLRPAELVLAGVGLSAATAIRLAEQLSGRRLFRPWGMLKVGALYETEDGGCSESFENMAPTLAFLETRITVGRSLCRIYPFREFVDAAAAAIRRDPSITHCGDPHCARRNDAVKGGPLIKPADAIGDRVCK